MINVKAMVFSHGQVVQNTKAIIKITNVRVMVFTHGQMVQNTKAIGLKVKDRAAENNITGNKYTTAAGRQTKIRLPQFSQQKIVNNK